MCSLSAVEFGSVQDAVDALGKVHMCSTMSVRARFLQGSLWNSSNVGLTEGDPQSSFQRRSSSASSFHAFLLQAIDGVIFKALCPQAMSVSGSSTLQNRPRHKGHFWRLLALRASLSARSSSVMFKALCPQAVSVSDSSTFHNIQRHKGQFWWLLALRASLSARSFLRTPVIQQNENGSKFWFDFGGLSRTAPRNQPFKNNFCPTDWRARIASSKFGSFVLKCRVEIIPYLETEFL